MNGISLWELRSSHSHCPTSASWKLHSNLRNEQPVTWFLEQRQRFYSGGGWSLNRLIVLIEARGYLFLPLCVL